MSNRKAKPMPASGFGKLVVTGAIATLLLASLPACSRVSTSTRDRQPRTAHSTPLTTDPYADQTPAQRRAAWLKRDPMQRSTASIADKDAGRRR